MQFINSLERFLTRNFQIIFNLPLPQPKSRLNSGNACYHSVQSLLSSRPLSRNVKVKLYKIIILPVVLYGCETWSVTLTEENTEGV
jgi:hypothetical protein